MKRRGFFVLTIFLSLLYTSCLADYLNEKFSYNHPLYIKYDIFDGVRSDDTKKVYPGYVLTAEDVKTPENPYDMTNPFVGWYLEPTYMTPVHEGFIVNADITLYGRWTNDYRYHPNENLYIFESYVLDYTQSKDFQLISSEMVTGLASYTPQETIGDCRLIQGAEETEIYYNYHYNGANYPVATITKLKYYNPQIQLENFQDLLNLLPDSSTDYTYYIKVFDSSMTYFSDSNKITSYGGLKMINLDLTGCIAIGFQSGQTFANKLWLREITLKMQEIKEQSFMGCSNLERVNLTSNVTTIGTGAFQNCTKLKSILIPSNVSVISAQTFDGCESLNTVYIPKNVTVIKDDAFKNTAIAQIFYEGTEAQRLILISECLDETIATSDPNIWTVEAINFWQ